jgi:uncharacterized protein YcbK (DUF882 family)
MTMQATLCLPISGALCLALVAKKSFQFPPVDPDLRQRVGLSCRRRAKTATRFGQPLPVASFSHTYWRATQHVYRNGDAYDQGSLARLNRYLRDHRTGEVHQYDPRVFDLLHDLTTSLGNPNLEIYVVCGYRTSWSNEFLRTHGHGVARHSLHMQAMAIDIRVPGIPVARLRDAALALHRGGVGYYASSNFVHVDVGRVRRW